MTTEPLLQVKELSKYFPVTRGALVSRKIGDIKAVDRISFDIYDGETLGLGGREWLWQNHYRSRPIETD